MALFKINKGPSANLNIDNSNLIVLKNSSTSSRNGMRIRRWYITNEIQLVKGTIIYIELPFTSTKDDYNALSLDGGNTYFLLYNNDNTFFSTPIEDTENKKLILEYDSQINDIDQEINEINYGASGWRIKNTSHTTEGYAYFTPDDGKFYIDVETANNVELGLNRIALNSFKADLSQSFTVNLTERSSFWTLNIPGLKELKEGLILHISVPTRPNDIYNVLNINGLGNKLIYYRYNEPLGDNIQVPAELTLIYKDNLSSFNQVFTNENNQDISYDQSGWVVDSAYNINKSDIYYGNLAGNAATATQLYHTPNHQDVFLRGDNTWTNKIIGDLNITNNIITDNINANKITPKTNSFIIDGNLTTNGLFTIGNKNFSQIYTGQENNAIGEEIIITNLNRSSYFKEISVHESYPWSYDEENNYWNVLNTQDKHSLNYLISSSWQALSDFALNINISVNSESISYDYLIIRVNNEEKKRVGGANQVNNITLFLKTNDIVDFIIRKDGSVNPSNEYYRAILSYQEYTSVYTIKVNKSFTPENSQQTLGTIINKWSKLYIGAKETYGSISQPIYWNNGVPTEITTLGIAYGGTGATSFTANSIIISGNDTTSPLTTRAIINNTLDLINHPTVTGIAIGTGISIPTMNTIYYGLVKVNNESQSRATTIYVPIEKGKSGQFLKSNGNNIPTWADFPIAATNVAGLIKIGTGATDAAAGNHTHTLEISSGSNASITLSQGSTYQLTAGGSTYTFQMPAAATVTLNGTSTTSASFYAPTSAGTNGYFLQSNGSGAPKWVSLTTTISYTSTTSTYYLIGYTNSPSETARALSNVYARSDVSVNSSGDLTAPRVYHAVWNDYAEYRQTDNIQPGKVYQENDNGCMTLTNQRLIPGCSIASDTFGSVMGKTLDAQTPMAVAGRVLVYTYQNRTLYHAGMAVCSAPNGTVDIMSREEIIAYPDCIIGYVSEIPDYKEWGSGHVQVDGRIWIKVK